MASSAHSIVDLKDYVFFQEGPGLRKWQWTEAGMKVINVTNILAGGSIDISNTSRFISLEEFQKKYSHFAIDVGDVVVASSGNTYGKVGRIKACHLPVMMNTSVIRFRPINPEVVHPDYLYAFLRSDFFRSQIERFVVGSAQPNFGPTHVKLMQLILPEWEHQRRIASIVSAYDDLIENNTRRIEILEEMARRLYEEWFCDLRFPDCEMAGKDWSVVQFGSVLKSSIGGGWGKDEIDDEHTIPGHVVRGTDIPSVKRLDVLRCPYRYHKLSNIRSRRLEAGDIVMEVSGGSHDQSVGRTLYVSKELLQLLGEDVICASFCKRLVVDNSVISPLLVYYHLDYLYRSGGLDQFQVQSTGIKNFQFTPFLEKHEISIPPVSLQEKFTTAVVPLLALHQVLGNKNANLRAQRDLLLPKLISGEIDVSDIPMPT